MTRPGFIRRKAGDLIGCAIMWAIVLIGLAETAK